MGPRDKPGDDKQRSYGTSLQHHHLALVDRAVGGEHDLEALDAVVHVLAEIEVLANGFQQVALFALAEIVVAGFVAHVDAGVGRFHVGVMPEDLVGFGMGVDGMHLDRLGLGHLAHDIDPELAIPSPWTAPQLDKNRISLPNDIP